MDVLIIEPSDKDNFKLIFELARKLNSKVSSLSKEKMEDLALLSLMNEEKSNEFVAKQEVIDELLK